ncbi:hypothetical protein, conserved [Leishmania lindenbergi]|uniref:Uncharacterized protein n=1 Tax=Leishmania lindenbergi TaxID=651832 RepID=A0AAW3AVY9_9TRYP
MSSSGIIVERGPSYPEAHSMDNEMLAQHEECEESPQDPQATKAAIPYCESTAEEEAHSQRNEEEESSEEELGGTYKPTDISADRYSKELELGKVVAAACSVNEELEEVKRLKVTGAASHAEAAPPEVAKTARPCEVSKPNKVKKSGNHAKKAKTAGPPAAPRKKRLACKVSIDNVEHRPPVPEGVNTPRSVALCKEYGVKPCELAPYDKSHFTGSGVSDEVAELRYQSYEKRRCARMAQLAPAYKRKITPGSDSVPVPDAKRQPRSAEEISTQSTATEKAAAHQWKPMDEDAAMQRQFETQHQRLLEQERCKTVTSGYDSDGHRRSSHPRAGQSYGASVLSAGSARSPGRYSVGMSVSARPTVDLPYSATKIYSASIAESRPLTHSEVFMIDEINEREAHRNYTQERAFVIQENTQLMHVERELMRAQRSCVSVRKRAEERRKMQEEMRKRTLARQKEAAERRERLVMERQMRVKENIAEKESRIHATNPYIAFMSRQMSSFSTRRNSSNSPLQGASTSNSQEQSAETEKEATMGLL